MAASGIAQRLPGWWYQRRLAPPLWPLLPLAWLFGLLVGLRRTFYRYGLLRSHRLPVPVIVVGNLTVGGSGKTPLVLWLVRCPARERLATGNHQSRLRRQRPASTSGWRGLHVFGGG